MWCWRKDELTVLNNSRNGGKGSSTFFAEESLSIAKSTPWLDAFFDEMHVKNPVLDRNTARVLVRQVCANGALIRLFSDRSILQDKLNDSTAMHYTQQPKNALALS